MHYKYRVSYIRCFGISAKVSKFPSINVAMHMFKHVVPRYQNNVFFFSWPGSSKVHWTSLNPTWIISAAFCFRARGSPLKRGPFWHELNYRLFLLTDDSPVGRSVIMTGWYNSKHPGFSKCKFSRVIVVFNYMCSLRFFSSSKVDNNYSNPFRVAISWFRFLRN